VQNKRTAMPVYIRNYMITKYGLKSIALSNLHAFVKVKFLKSQLAPAFTIENDYKDDF